MFWSYSRREYDALHHVYVESRGGGKKQQQPGAQPQRDRGEWPSQPLDEKKAFLRQQLELCAAVARVREKQGIPHPNMTKQPVKPKKGK